MVVFASLIAFTLFWLQAQDDTAIPLDRLDGATRAKVLAALAGLVILGLSMIALTWLGARVTKRYMHPKRIKPVRRRSSAPPQDDWTSKPLVEFDTGDGSPDDSPDGAPEGAPNS